MSNTINITKEQYLALTTGAKIPTYPEIVITAAGVKETYTVKDCAHIGDKYLVEL